MTVPPDSPEQNETQSPAHASHLKPLRVRGDVLAYAVAGVVLAGAGLLLITLFPRSPWLFLLYPVLFGVLLASLSAIVLHLLHRFGEDSGGERFP